jgi:hypothetical protein
VPAARRPRAPEKCGAGCCNGLALDDAHPRQPDVAISRSISWRVGCNLHELPSFFSRSCAYTSRRQPALALRPCLPSPSRIRPAEVDADVAAMSPTELVQVVLNASGSPPRAERAVRVLVDRGYWYDLLDSLEGLCRSEDLPQRLKGVQLIRYVHPSANRWLRRQTRALLLRLVDRQNQREVVDAALAALEEAATQH